MPGQTLADLKAECRKGDFRLAATSVPGILLAYGVLIALSETNSSQKLTRHVEAAVLAGSIAAIAIATGVAMWLALRTIAFPCASCRRDVTVGQINIAVRTRRCPHCEEAVVCNRRPPSPVALARYRTYQQTVRGELQLVAILRFGPLVSFGSLLILMLIPASIHASLGFAGFTAFAVLYTAVRQREWMEAVIGLLLLATSIHIAWDALFRNLA